MNRKAVKQQLVNHASLPFGKPIESVVYKGVEGICRRAREYMEVQRRYKGVEGICRRVRGIYGITKTIQGSKGDM